MKRRWLRILIALAALAVIREGITFLMARRRPVSSSTSLKDVAAEVNRLLPAMIGTEIQLVHTMAAEGRFVYDLRLVHYSGTSQAYQAEVPGIRRTMLQTACENPTAKNELLGRGITLRYNVAASDGHRLATFEIRPADCGL